MPPAVKEEVGTVRRCIEGRSVRWNAQFAESAVRSGHWSGQTAGDALRAMAGVEPDRILIVDRDLRLSANELLQRAERLAAVMAHTAPRGSVVSFMLPNWHEAAIIYFAATFAGMVAHPLLPSLREHDLAFMLADADSRFIFVPAR